MNSDSQEPKDKLSEVLDEIVKVAGLTEAAEYHLRSIAQPWTLDIDKLINIGIGMRQAAQAATRAAMLIETQVTALKRRKHI